MVMVFEPTESEIEPDAEPEVTEVPFTVTVANELLTVGVTVIEVSELDTEAVYEVVPEAKVGDRVPTERLSPLNVLTIAAAVRLTVIV